MLCPNTSPNLPILNLNVRPNINGMIDQYGDDVGDSPALFGWSGSEYDGFLNLGMYNAGKNQNPATPRIGTAFVAFDCTEKKLCVAAYMNGTTIFGIPGYDCTIDQVSASTWIQIAINDKNGDTKKYFAGEAVAFEYVKFPDNSFPGGQRPIGKC